MSTSTTLGPGWAAGRSAHLRLIGGVHAIAGDRGRHPGSASQTRAVQSPGLQGVHSRPQHKGFCNERAGWHDVAMGALVSPVCRFCCMLACMLCMGGTAAHRQEAPDGAGAHGQQQLIRGPPRPHADGRPTSALSAPGVHAPSSTRPPTRRAPAAGALRRPLGPSSAVRESASPCKCGLLLVGGTP